MAKVHLDELRRFSAGNTAPDIQGVDLDGKPMKLTDYRGKVVVLFVSGFGRPFTNPPERAPAFIIGNLPSAPQTMEGKPVFFLGSSRPIPEEYKKEVDATGLPIRFWWDSGARNARRNLLSRGCRLPSPASILTAWDAEMPNCYVIDKRGEIRYTHVFGLDILEDAVTVLIREQDN